MPRLHLHFTAGDLVLVVLIATLMFVRLRRGGGGGNGPRDRLRPA
jgi:hypothetical protein